MCERAFVTKLTVPLDKPSANTFRLTGFVARMGEGARDAGGTGANLEKLARNVREVLGFGRTFRFRSLFTVLAISVAVLLPIEVTVGLVISIFIENRHDKGARRSVCRVW